MAKKGKKQAPPAPVAAPPTPAPVGRPTDYRPEYCPMLVDHMAGGYSFESFAGKVSVSKQTIYDWAENNAQFLDAKQIGTEKSRFFWERIGIGGAAGAIKNFNPAAWIFSMKNRFSGEWRDKHEVDNTHKFEPTVLTLPLAGQRIVATTGKDQIYGAGEEKLPGVCVLQPDTRDAQGGGVPPVPTPDRSD